MLRGVPLLALGTVLGASTLASQPAPVAPQRIDSIFARYDRTAAPGCALGVYRDGRMAYTRGYGMADLNQGIAISPGTVFYIASTSKQFAAASIALLAEQGRLSLDDPVRRHVPELPAWADGITVGHLVYHTSGIRDYLGLWALSGRSFADEIPEAVALDLIARQRGVDFPAGTRWSYSNSGYFLLSVIVRRVTGQSLRDFAEAAIFGPLGMTSTHFHDDNTMIVPRRAEGYLPDGRGGFRIVRTSFALVGDGGLLTTVEDLLRWDRNFADNRLGRGGPALIELLTTPGRLSDGRALTYAFGLMPGRHRGLATIRHGGAFIGFRAELLRFPDQRLSVAVLCNDGTADPSDLAERVAAVYLGDRMEPAVAAGGPGPLVVVPVSTLARYAGRYEVQPGFAVEVRLAGDGLELRAFGPPSRLVARSESTFVAEGSGTDVRFQTGAGGVPAVLLGTGPLVEPAPRLPDSVSYSATQLAAFAGRYQSDELDTWYTIQVEGEQVRLRPRLGEWVTLSRLRPDQFAGLGARLDFARDRAGRVTGFTWSAGRARGIVATRASR